MRKILKIALTTIIACITAIAFSVCAYAETEDVELPVTKAKASNGGWGQSITYDRNEFDCSRITPDSIVYVEFELDKEWTNITPPVELIFQNYTSADPQIWAKIEPFEWDETSASFDYESMVAVYGSDDFSTVDNVWLGDAGVVMKATKFTISNCTVVEVTTVSETEATTEEVTEAETEAAEAETTPAPAAEETEAETTAAQTESSGGGIPLIPIVIGAVVVAAVVVTLVILKKNKNKFY